MPELALLHWLPQARSPMIVLLAVGLILSGCVKLQSTEVISSQLATPILLSTDSPDSASPSPAIAVNTISTATLLQQSWQAYRQRFIQTDGRVIDREAGDRTISEGQAYAMLRAVLMDDPETFARTLAWSEENLKRPGDRLWAWKWGQDDKDSWGILDENFASDADLDAITALILASRRWQRPDYLELARAKLQDLWNLATVPITTGTAETRYFLPGPKAAFQPQPTLIYLNPSYLAPYAFRLFAQVDGDRNWLSLVDSSYEILNQSAALSTIGLPSDWITFDGATGQYLPMAATNPLQSRYGFDAYRVWWRVGLDAAWFDEPRARQYLQQHLRTLQAMWRSRQAIPAQIDLQGQPMVNYESTAQYAMLYAAFQLTDPATADQIRQQKLLPAYQSGFWDSDSAYYSQNMGWFGLFPPTQVAANLLQP